MASPTPTVAISSDSINVTACEPCGSCQQLDHEFSAYLRAVFSIVRSLLIAL
jgi:hypothetical protein